MVVKTLSLTTQFAAYYTVMSAVWISYVASNFINTGK